MAEDIVGCKWSLMVLQMIRSGTNRPGEMVRATDGLTTKVLNERLAKLLRFGIVRKIVFAESPPRVEYQPTAFGTKFFVVLDAIAALQEEIERK